MTLFEAIRQLKEGQAIEKLGKDDYYYAQCGERVVAYRAVEWRHGEPKMTVLKNGVDLNVEVRIIDLPKPKMSLEEGLYEAAEAIPYELLENPSPRQFTKHFVNTLRSLPIDWQAEADRKERK